MFTKRNLTKISHHYLLIILVTMASIIASCQKKDGGSGGSVVGNGFVRYHDKTYDYFFEYARDLTLTELSSDSRVLHNESATRSYGSRKSTINFEVVRLAEHGAASIAEYIAKISNDSSWQTLNQPKAKGFYKKNTANNELEAHYVFKLSNDVILDVTANAFPDANGIALMSHVLDSIGFDTTPPIIHEVLFEPSTVRAGDVAKLKVRATDNMNNIRDRASNGSVGVRLEQNCRSLVNKNWELTEACGEFRAVGNDWYEIEVPTNPRMKTGEYILHPLTLWDDAGNSIELFHDIDKGVYQSGSSSDQTQIPLVYLRVENSSEDSKAPTLANVYFDPPSIRAGEPTKLIFISEDNDMNFQPHNFCERALNHEWFKYTREDLPKNAEFDPTEYSVKACKNPIKRSDGSWEVEIETAKGLPPGDYEMDFLVRDVAGNKSELRSAVLYIETGDKVDQVGPEIIAIRTDKSSYKRGETGRIYIKATDELSGISNNLSLGLASFCRQRLVPKERYMLHHNTSEQVFICDGTFKKTGDDWYSMDFKLPEKLNIGEYILPEFSITDRVGNSTILRADMKNSETQNYKIKYKEQDANISVLQFNVID